MSELLEWKTLRVADAAFEIDMPGEAVSQPMPEDGTADGMRGRMYMVTTPDDALAVFVQYLDLATGEYMIEPSALANVARIAVEGMGGELTDLDSTMIDGRVVRTFAGSVGDTLLADGVVRTRGNRMYMTLCVRSPRWDASIGERFHASFREIPFRETQWIDVDLGDRGYEVRLPSTPVYAEDTLYRGRTIRSSATARDNNTGQSYSTAVYTFSDYYSAENLDSHMLQFVVPQNRWSDMVVLRDSTFTLGGLPARDVIVGRGSEKLHQRFRYVAAGRRLYEATTLTTDPTRRAVDEAFFASLRVSAPAGEADLTKSRMPKILADLASPDTTTRDAAHEALSWAIPSPDDLPALLDAAGRSYDDTRNYASTNERIVNTIARLGDADAVDMLLERFSQLKPTARAAALNLLLERQEMESIERFVELVTTTPADAEMWDNIYFWKLDNEQPELIAALVPRLYTLLDSAAAQGDLLSLTVRALNAEAVELETIEKHRPALLAVVRAALTTMPDDTLWHRQSLRSASVNLLAKLTPDDETRSLLAVLSNDSTAYIAAAALRALFEMKAPVSAEAVRTLAENRYYRIDIYSLCLENDRLDLYPKEMMTQDRFAESIAYSAIAEDDEELADSLELVASRVVTVSGTTGRAHLFRIKGGDEAWVKTVLVGLQPSDESEVSADGDLVVFGEERFEDYTIDEHVAQLIEKDEKQRAAFARIRNQYEGSIEQE